MTLPYAHVLQTWEWGEFKRETTGWQPIRLAFKRGDVIVALASIGVRSVGPFKVMYAPKGPALAYEDISLTSAILDHLQHLARQHNAIWLKIDPDVIRRQAFPAKQTTHPIPPDSHSSMNYSRGAGAFPPIRCSSATLSPLT